MKGWIIRMGFLANNPGHDIFAIYACFRCTLIRQYVKLSIRVASEVANQLKTKDLRKSGVTLKHGVPQRGTPLVYLLVYPCIVAFGQLFETF